MRYFTMHWGAAGSGWSEEHTLRQILEALEYSPFAPFTPATRMDANFLNRWQPYDREAALTILQRGKEPTLQLRIQPAEQEDASLICYVSRGMIRSRVTWNVNEDNMRGHERETILQWLSTVSDRLPNFTDGSAKGAFDMREFRDQHQLPNLAKPDILGWAHLLTPAIVAYNYESIDVFLRAPAHRVRQIPDSGLIELVVYADPLGYDLPESQQRIIEVTRYLAAHRHERFRRRPIEEQHDAQ